MEIVAGIVLGVVIVGCLIYLTWAISRDDMHLPAKSYWPPAHPEDFTNFFKMFSPFKKYRPFN